jgi:hypothetical protein
LREWKGVEVQGIEPPPGMGFLVDRESTRMDANGNVARVLVVAGVGMD